MNTNTSDNEFLQIELTPYHTINIENKNDLDQVIFDLDSKIGLLSSQADKYDYLLSIGSGILCGMLDILWVGDFSLKRGRDYASDMTEEFVKKTAKLLGCEKDDLSSAVKFLEKKFPIPSDGNMPDFGGGLQHHLRDFAHHPTIVGLMFSLLTQFTEKSYGTDVNGLFIVVNVPEKSKVFIGKDVPEKIFFGTIVWFFHLVSDMAGSSSRVGLSGGTGIPGPLLSLAKELSVLPFFKNIKIGEDSLSLFLSKLFNGTLLAKRDENGKIIKDAILRFDLRGELGVGIELGRQAVPVIANECIVRTFYFIHRLAKEMRKLDVHSLSDMAKMNWDNIKPANNPTIARMLTISTGVFTMLDIGDAAISQKYWVSVNYIGIGRFVVAIGEDISWGLKVRNIRKIKEMYQNIERFAYKRLDEKIYKDIGKDLDIDQFGLTVEQTEILYNLECLKVQNDIRYTLLPHAKALKLEWLNEWKGYISNGFGAFLQLETACLHWYSEEKLIRKIEQNNPSGVWFRLVLLEAMIFEPYYPLGLEKNKKGNDIPSRKYSALQNPLLGYEQGLGDSYLDSVFHGNYYKSGYVKRLRKCYNKTIFELNQVLKTALTSLGITAAITIATVATAGALAPATAVTLVGSNFAGLHGAALTSACVAYFGGGAIVASGAGMAGGTIAIVGGGAMLGLGMGAGVGGAVGFVGLTGKRNTILQSAKLLVAVREIFLNDEHDIAFSNSVYEKYVQNIIEIEKGLVELKIQTDDAGGKEKKELKNKIKNAQESVDAMKVARKSFLKFKSSFEQGSHMA